MRLVLMRSELNDWQDDTFKVVRLDIFPHPVIGDQMGTAEANAWMQMMDADAGMDFRMLEPNRYVIAEARAIITPESRYADQAWARSELEQDKEIEGYGVPIEGNEDLMVDPPTSIAVDALLCDNPPALLVGDHEIPISNEDYERLKDMRQP